MPDQPPYTTDEIKAAARRLRRTFGDEPIALGENGWKRLIEMALNAIADERVARTATLTGEDHPQ